MTYEATITSAGGEDVVPAKFFIICAMVQHSIGTQSYQGCPSNRCQDLRREVIKNFTIMESQEMSYGEMSIMQQPKKPLESYF